MAKSKSVKKSLKSCTINPANKLLQPGDCVLMRAQDPEKPPYVARIEKMEGDNESSKRKNVKVQIRWYYRPEESIGGRRQFHGVKELFLSDHYDVQSADTIEGKCTVHSFKNYTKLESVGSEDYFCRFEYNASTGGFTPDRVAVYCKCELPYNPDDLMVQCESCKDWFHPACINLTTNRLKTIEHFTCPDCLEEAQKKPRNGTRDFSSLEIKVASSSSAERNWSTYSFIHSVKRNRLGAKKAEDLVYVHSNLRLLSHKKPDYSAGATKNWDLTPECADLDATATQLAVVSTDEVHDDNEATHDIYLPTGSGVPIDCASNDDDNALDEDPYDAY